MRLIIASTENASKEYIIFTSDEITPAREMIPAYTTINCDKLVDIDTFPESFPFEYILERKNLT